MSLAQFLRSIGPNQLPKSLSLNLVPSGSIFAPRLSFLYDLYVAESSVLRAARRDGL